MKNQEVVNSFDVTVWESLKALLGSGYIIERFTTALTLNSLECLVILQPKWMKSNEGVYSSGETLWENQKPRLGSCFVVKKSTTTLNLSILKYLEYSVGPTNGKPRCGLHFWRNFGKKWKNLSNRCFVVWESIAALTLNSPKCMGRRKSQGMVNSSVTTVWENPKTLLNKFFPLMEVYTALTSSLL